ncbi:MAG: hypothetical protein ACRC2O_10915, partial [Chitinophagaceae bacterium]
SFERNPMNRHKPSAKTGFDRQFSIEGVVKHDIPALNWQLTVYGIWSKLLKIHYLGNSDDEGNIDFSRRDKFSWGEYFKGYIRSEKDTISNFFVYTKPASQEIFSGVMKTALSYNYVSDPEHFKKAFHSKRNFAITGFIGGIPFKIIYIEPVRMIWIFKEEQLRAVFATEDINNPDLVKAGGQAANKTFLLLKTGHRWDDEAEMIRLSMLTMLIADLVKPGNIY